jgi:predicted GNAT family acetyltransferase
MITHNKEEFKFETRVDGHDAELTYRKEGQVLVFDHTYVPDALRGKGIAKELVEFGIIYARENNYKIQPKCSYVIGYFEKFKDDLADIKA